MGCYITIVRVVRSSRHQSDAVGSHSAANRWTTRARQRSQADHQPALAHADSLVEVVDQLFSKGATEALPQDDSAAKLRESVDQR